jgi:hypothetical protein
MARTLLPDKLWPRGADLCAAEDGEEWVSAVVANSHPGKVKGDPDHVCLFLKRQPWLEGVAAKEGTKKQPAYILKRVDDVTGEGRPFAPDWRRELKGPDSAARPPHASQVVYVYSQTSGIFKQAVQLRVSGRATDLACALDNRTPTRICRVLAWARIFNPWRRTSC